MSPRYVEPFNICNGCGRKITIETLICFACSMQAIRTGKHPRWEEMIREVEDSFNVQSVSAGSQATA